MSLTVAESRSQLRQGAMPQCPHTLERVRDEQFRCEFHVPAQAASALMTQVPESQQAPWIRSASAQAEQSDPTRKVLLPVQRPGRLTVAQVPFRAQQAPRAAAHVEVMAQVRFGAKTLSAVQFAAPSTLVQPVSPQHAPPGES